MSDRIVFSTDALPERDRFAIWREEILGRYPHCHITTQDPTGFRATNELQRVGAIDIAWSSMSAAQYTRTSDLLRDGNDTLLIALVERGAGYHEQREDDRKVGAGDAIVMDSAYCGNTIFSTDSQFWLLRIPRQKIAASLPSLTHFGRARLDRDRTALRLLHHYLDGSLDTDLDFSGSAGQLYEEHIIGLLALALGAEGEVRQTIERGACARCAAPQSSPRLRLVCTIRN